MPISTANDPAAKSAWRARPKPTAPAEPLDIPPHPAFLPSIDPAMNAALAPLDRIAAEMESIWGVDRLQTLVSPDTARRFASAKRKLDLAIRAKDPALAAVKAEILIRGWRALEAEAQALGNNPRAFNVWCVRHPVTTKAYAIVRHAKDVDACRRLYSDHTVIPLDDLISSHMVTFRAQQMASEPLPDDEIPF